MMSAKMIPLGLLATAFAAAGCSHANRGEVESRVDAAATSASPPAMPANGAQPMILNLRGTGTVEMRTIVLDGVPTPNKCFTVDVIDVSTQRVVGKGTDCLAAQPGDEYPEGLEVVGTTTFDFDGGHTFTSRGLTSVQPKTHGSPAITHVTGAIPPEGENSIVDATGRFQGMQARVRLSGAVNMSRMEQGQVYFDCIFVVHPL